MHYHGRKNTYACIERAYTNIKLRPSIKIKHTVNSFSDHFHAVLLQKNNQVLMQEKGYWILNNALLSEKDYKNAIIQLWNNRKSQTML